MVSRGGKVAAEGANELGVEFGGVHIGGEDGDTVLPCHVKTFRQNGLVMGENDAGHMVAHDDAEGIRAGGAVHRQEKRHFGFSDDLDAGGVKVFEVPQKLDAGAVKVGRVDPALLIVRGGVGNGETVLGHDNGELYGVFLFQGAYLPSVVSYYNSTKLCQSAINFP